MQGKRFRKSSLATYFNFMEKLLRFNTKPISELTNRDLELFVEEKIARHGYAISTHRKCISALRHFAALYDYSGINADRISRPRKDKKLPTVLSSMEVIDLLRATRYLKHRVIFALLYSSGLHIGEALNVGRIYYQRSPAKAFEAAMS